MAYNIGIVRYKGHQAGALVFHGHFSSFFLVFPWLSLYLRLFTNSPFTFDFSSINTLLEAVSLLILSTRMGRTWWLSRMGA